MCGIVGILKTKDKSPVSGEILCLMRDELIHRGPDGAGLWMSPSKNIGLAHRRLSIVDLDVAANQPMCNEDSSIWVTYNGEIYNHSVIRNELISLGHSFKTNHSDTEVLVHGYEQWGLDSLLERLQGDYAFAIWDQNLQKLSLARDRVGVKPLYFFCDEKNFIFASEIKAILKNPDVQRDVEPIALYHYLSFLTTPAPLTMFKGIYKLPAGHAMTIDNLGEIRSWKYWDALPGQGIDKSEISSLSEKAREEFYICGIQNKLSESVNLRMMSDVPIGVFLSGGVDSSTNVALMSQYMSRPVDTFTVGFKDYQDLNELEFANQISDLYKTNHHEILIDESDMINYFDQLIYSQDEPIADWVCIPLYFVSKLTKDSGVTVIQVGEGSDEQFCGYSSYMGYLDLYYKYWQPFQKFVPKKVQSLLARASQKMSDFKPSLEVYADIIQRAAHNKEHFWTGATVFWESIKRKLVSSSSDWNTSISPSLLKSGMFDSSILNPDSYYVIASFVNNIGLKFPNSDVLTRMIHNEFKLRLPELLLMRVDKITMSNSLEARVPFLDHELVNFTMDIPGSYKVKNNEPKYLLKKAVEGLIPENVIYRKKMGFGAPMSDWLRGPFGDFAEETILSSKLMDRDLFEVQHIQSLIHDHRESRRDTSLYIWTLLNLCAWYDRWIDI